MNQPSKQENQMSIIIPIAMTAFALAVAGGIIIQCVVHIVWALKEDRIIPYPPVLFILGALSGLIITIYTIWWKIYPTG